MSAYTVNVLFKYLHGQPSLLFILLLSTLMFTCWPVWKCLRYCSDSYLHRTLVFVCLPPPLQAHAHSHTCPFYFYSCLAVCHISRQRGSPPVAHVCSTCKNTTRAQRKYSILLKRGEKKWMRAKVRRIEHEVTASATPKILWEF